MNAPLPRLNSSTTRVAAIVTAIGVALFIDVEIVAMAAAAVWAVAGILHLPTVLTVVLALAIGLPAAWACWLVLRTAWRAEMSEPIL